MAVFHFILFFSVHQIKCSEKWPKNQLSSFEISKGWLLFFEVIKLLRKCVGLNNFLLLSLSIASNICYKYYCRSIFLIVLRRWYFQFLHHHAIGYYLPKQRKGITEYFSLRHTSKKVVLSFSLFSCKKICKSSNANIHGRGRKVLNVKKVHSLKIK